MAERIAKHDYLDATGNPIGNDIKNAHGIRYAVEGKGQFDRMLPTDPNVLRMSTALMWRTLATREAGAVLRDDGDWNDVVEALDGRFSAIERGDWKERAEGVARGPKYDKAILAQAIYDTLSPEARSKADSLGGVQHYVTKLEDRGYYAKAIRHPIVMPRYHELNPAAAAVEDSDALA